LIPAAIGVCPQRGRDVGKTSDPLRRR
jgi:hypothetical protein